MGKGSAGAGDGVEVGSLEAVSPGVGRSVGRDERGLDSGDASDGNERDVAPGGARSCVRIKLFDMDGYGSELGSVSYVEMTVAGPSEGVVVGLEAGDGDG